MDKQCKTCKETKPLDFFGITRQNKDGHSGHCKLCINAYWRRKWKNATKKRKRSPEAEKRLREQHVFKVFGLSVDGYNEMFATQKGMCAICGTHQSELKKLFAVDHDHETGNVRGLLCQKCNTAIAFLKDDAEIMENAIVYLNKRKVRKKPA